MDAAAAAKRPFNLADLVAYRTASIVDGGAHRGGDGLAKTKKQSSVALSQTGGGVIEKYVGKEQMGWVASLVLAFVVLREHLGDISLAVEGIGCSCPEKQAVDGELLLELALVGLGRGPRHYY